MIAIGSDTTMAVTTIGSDNRTINYLTAAEEALLPFTPRNVNHMRVRGGPGSTKIYISYSRTK